MLDCHIYPVHALHALSPNGPCALQYYDIPSPSLRNAVYQEMQADIAPFKVGAARKQSALCCAGSLHCLARTCCCDASSSAQLGRQAVLANDQKLH